MSQRTIVRDRRIPVGVKRQSAVTNTQITCTLTACTRVFRGPRTMLFYDPRRGARAYTIRFFRENSARTRFNIISYRAKKIVCSAEVKSYTDDIFLFFRAICSVRTSVATNDEGFWGGNRCPARTYRGPRVSVI